MVLPPHGGGLSKNVRAQLFRCHRMSHQLGQTTHSVSGNSPLFPGENRLAADTKSACRSTDTPGPMYRFFYVAIRC